MKFIQEYSYDIKKLCDKHNVQNLYAFGSVLKENFSNKSDVDLIVDFKKMDPQMYTDNYFNLKFSLEDLFNKPVDLLEEQAIRNPYFKSHIAHDRELIYGNWN